VLAWSAVLLLVQLDLSLLVDHGRGRPAMMMGIIRFGAMVAGSCVKTRLFNLDALALDTIERTKETSRSTHSSPSL